MEKELTGLSKWSAGRSSEKFEGFGEKRNDVGLRFGKRRGFQSFGFEFDA